MMNPEGLIKQALAFHQTGNLGDAERLYLQLMRAVPQDATAPHLLGVVRAQQGRNREALELMGAALKLKPHAPEVLSNYANVLKTQGRFTEALANYDKALKAKPDYVAALAKRAMVLRDLGRLEAGLESVERALALQPDHVEALNTRGVILAELKRSDDALASYGRALALAPNFPDTLNNRALLLKGLKRPEDALADVERALTVHGGFVEAWNNRGIILFDLKRMGDAIDSYDSALALRPDYAEAFNNRAVALWSQKRFAESLADCDRAVGLRPDFSDAMYNRANALAELNRMEEALAGYEQVLALAPDHPSALSGLANAALMIGDWQRTAALAPRLKADVLEDKSIIQPFVLMGYHDDNELQLRCSQNYVRQAGPGPLPPLWSGERYSHDRVRVAYLSADLHQHVTASLMVEMFECHDRTRFETIAVSFGPDVNSPMRQRLMGTFDSFVDASLQDDRSVAQMLRQWEVDIAVDLGGHTSGARPWVLAHRPAPVQAKYMGYPGTSGCDFIDYIVADRMVVPPDQDRFFSEKIAALPTTLWVTDTMRELLPPPTRAEAGLPETGFVFCCFNHNWKITPPQFDIWMRLLGQVDGSVLWLLEGNASIRYNLRKEAAARGIAPERLIFAGRTTPDAHLARQQLADLFLDTLPYNAHTTASDALWASLPLLTVPGHSFPARVAASILQAAGLPELIADDFAAYEAKALELARNPGALTARFTRELEAAYLAMMEAALPKAI
ncbi:MAG: tetratricopeptide repeat protein [Alphaproteobacteria bacterium]|nr:tetratricopeptide repeat protein [Alphaproteobacteria bacterium]